MPKLITMDPALGDDQAEIIDALEWLQIEATDRDVVIIDSYGTKLWMASFNHWRSSSRWYSLPFEIPSTTDGILELSSYPSSAAIDLFEWVEIKYERLWYVATDQAPDFYFQREESWLDNNYHNIKNTNYQGVNTIDIRLYELDCIGR